MTVDARAGKPPDPSMLANIQWLMTAYYMRRPDPSIREQRVTFGTRAIAAPPLLALLTRPISSPSPRLVTAANTKAASYWT
jgi:hypothetical protein